MALAADALRKTAAATVYRASKNIVFSQTHTHASMTAVNVSLFGFELQGPCTTFTSWYASKCNP